MNTTPLLEKPTRKNDALPRMGQAVKPVVDVDLSSGWIESIEDVDENGILVKFRWGEDEDNWQPIYRWSYAYWDNLKPVA